MDRVILYVIGHPAWLQKSQAGKTDHGVKSVRVELKGESLRKNKKENTIEVAEKNI
ncbi:MAG TPA: hypothetical protein VIM07_11975 [Chitinophagaceae bacterium]